MTREELQAMLKSMNADLAERIAEAQRKALEPKPGPAIKDPDPNAGKDREWDTTTRIARAVRYLFEAGGNKMAALDIANKIGDQQVIKAMGEGTLAGGGAMVQGDFSSDIISVLRARAVIRDLGVRSVPMNGGSLTMPYGATGATAGYVGENSNITHSNPTTGQINFVAHKLAVTSAQSNELLADSSGRSDAFIRDDIAAAMGDKENTTLIRGDGTGNTPIGLKSLATQASQNFAANASVTIANVTDDLGTAILKLEEDNIPIGRGGWIFAPRTRHYLMTARDSNGNLVFEPEMKGGTLFGFPFRVTTAVPVNLGGGSDSEIYFASFDQLVLAEADSLSLEVFPGGAYHDGSNVISGISQDQTVIRAIARHDFNDRYRGKSCALITGVTWGA